MAPKVGFSNWLLGGGGGEGCDSESSSSSSLIMETTLRWEGKMGPKHNKEDEEGSGLK